MTPDKNALPEGGQIYSNSIPAGKTALIPLSGTSFEFLVQTGACRTRFSDNKNYSPYSVFQNGMGLRNIHFTKLEVENLENVPIVVSLAVGSANFINRQLVLGNSNVSQIVKPTYYPTATPVTSVAIQDVSGSKFFDINGVQWLALNRLAIDVFNLDSANPYLLQKYGATLAGDPAAGAVQPLTPVKFAYSGNFTIRFGSNIDAIVSEIYAAIPPT